MKRILCLMLSVAMFCSFLSGCSIEVAEAQNEETKTYTLYYLDVGETELKEESYVPEDEATEVMVKNLMQHLEDQVSDTEKVRLLPEEVTINSFDLQENQLVIDFNRRYLKMSRAREILVRVGIVKTFLQVPDIKKVCFTVSGEPLTDSKNNEIGAMTSTTFLEYTSDDMDEYRYETFTLYFTDASGEHLVEEQRNVYYKRTLPKERVVLEQLAKGPMVKGNYPTIPDSVQTLNVITADRICYVDVNRSFQEFALDINEMIPVYSVVNSLLAACEADKVQISIEGKANGTFGQNMKLYDFYEKNEELVIETEEIVDAQS